MESQKTGSDAAVQPAPRRPAAMKRYEALAAEIAGSIRAGIGGSRDGAAATYQPERGFDRASPSASSRE